MRRLLAALLLLAPAACAGMSGSRDLAVGAGPPRDGQPAAASSAPADPDAHWHVGPSEGGVAVELRF